MDRQQLLPELGENSSSGQEVAGADAPPALVFCHFWHSSEVRSGGVRLSTLSASWRTSSLHQRKMLARFSQMCGGWLAAHLFSLVPITL